MTPERAKELYRLKMWEWHGTSSQKPPFPDTTEQEDKEIIELWNKLPGETCYMDALGKIMAGKQPVYQELDYLRKKLLVDRQNQEKTKGHLKRINELKGKL